jgi:3-oxoadipate enol-lactonase
MLDYEVSPGDGQELALIHAGICDSGMWDAQWQTLGQRYRTVRHDMRGFGKSPLPDDDFSNTLDAAEVIADAGFGPTVLVGASMGGAVAIDAALAFPDRTAGLVLVCAAIPGHQWSAEVHAYGELEDIALEDDDLDAAAAVNVDFWVDGPQRTSLEVDADVRRRVHEMQKRAFELQIHAPADLEEHALVPDAGDRLSEIACPTLVIVGSIDRDDILQMAEQLVAEIPDVKFASIEHTAHLPSMEQPGEFDQLIDQFIATLPV